MWLSLVERLLWEQNVAGSNPVTPTIFRNRKNFEMYFEYGEKEINYLKAKDKKPAAVIDRIGKVRRAADTDLFSSVVHHIVGQQISTKAQQTIWNRLTNSTGKITPEAIGGMDAKELQSFGISFKKSLVYQRLRLKSAKRRV